MADIKVTIVRDGGASRPDEPEKWSAIFEGEEIVKRKRDPEYDACRALLSRGITGRVQFYTSSGTPSLSMDIEKAAGFRMAEDDSHGLHLVKYVPFPDAVFGVQRVSSSSEGLVPANDDNALDTPIREVRHDRKAA